LGGIPPVLQILGEICSNFFERTPPRITFRKIKVGSLGAKRLGMVFFRYFEGIFKIARQRSVGNAEIRTNLFEKIPNLLEFSC